MDIIGFMYVYLYILIIYIQPSIFYNLKRLNELIRIINSNPNNTWVAGHNNISNELELELYTSNKIEPQNNSKVKKLIHYFNLFASDNYFDFPTEFDARKKWSSNAGDPAEKCPTVRKVFNSGKCKCGWAISIVAVVSDRLCISSNYKIKQQLSSQQLISCCKDCCSCKGGDIQLGWEYVKQKGLVTGGSYKSNTGCQPYLMVPCQKSYECSTENSKVPECLENTCNINDKNITRTESFVKTHIKDYYSLPRNNPSKIMKDIIEHGPLQVSMHMYEDFRIYSRGIYRHIAGDLICDHGVKLIGWGAENNVRYWILLNSFGPLWGEHGLFKISMDENDNTDFGYAIIGPRFYINNALTTLGSIILICSIQIFRSLY